MHDNNHNHRNNNELLRVLTAPDPYWACVLASSLNVRTLTAKTKYTHTCAHVLMRTPASMRLQGTSVCSYACGSVPFINYRHHVNLSLRETVTPVWTSCGLYWVCPQYLQKDLRSRFESDTDQELLLQVAYQVRYSSKKLKK